MHGEAVDSSIIHKDIYEGGQDSTHQRRCENMVENFVKKHEGLKKNESPL